MIEIPDAPTVNACATCDSSLTWLYSARKQAWIAFVVQPLDTTLLRVHGCRHAQHPPTWRQLPRREPPNAEYLAVKATLPTPPSAAEKLAAVARDKAEKRTEKQDEETS